MDACTDVLLADGTSIAAKDVQSGTVLLDARGVPCKVDGVRCYTDDRYAIKPTKGDTFVIAGGAELLFVYSGNHALRWRKDKEAWQVTSCDDRGRVTYCTAKTYDEAKEVQLTQKQTKGGLIRMTVTDVMLRSNSFRQRLMLTRGFITGHDNGRNMLDPYFVGLWLGDGTSSGPGITTADNEIVAYLESLCTSLGMTLSQKGHLGYYMAGTRQGVKGSNFVYSQLLSDNLINNKHIPLRYFTETRNVRLSLLAGLIDSDGHLSRNCYDIIQKRQCLANGIVTLCRSLGFAAYVAPCQKSCLVKGAKVTGEYFRVGISGEGLDTIPVLLSRKLAGPRQQRKDARRTGFCIEKLGSGTVIGLNVKGHAVLLKDFTVVKS